MRVKNSIAVAFCVFTVFINSVNACGVSTHLDVAYRAMRFFEYTTGSTDYKRILEEHVDAFQGSTSFADSFYNGLCLPNEDFAYVSEDTHWTPFINVSVNYIRDNYPPPWDEATEKLVTFLFGIVSHQVSDVLWHALDVDQAFLETMGNVNFHGSFDAAHGVGDFGGDVVNRYDLDMSFIKKIFYWYIPTEDLVNIYRLYYGDDRVTADAIVTCSNWFYLARLGEQLGVIETLFPRNADASPFLIERLQDFFLGGMDDMALWIMDRWHVTADLLEYGTDVCELTYNPVFITCDEELIHKTNASMEWIDRKKKSLDHALKGYEYSGVTDKANHYDGKITEKDIIQKKEHRGTTFEMGIGLQALFKESIEMRNVKQNTVPEIQMNNSTTSTVTLTTAEEYSRLGESLLFGDVNTDGYDDLIIGAPGYSIPNGYQNGRVYIFYGNHDGFSSETLLVEQSADVILEALDPNGRFGTAVAVLDFNMDGRNDVVVTAPYTGALDLAYQGTLYVYFGEEDGSIQEIPGTFITCLETYCNFGITLSTGYLNSDDFLDLVVGSPFASHFGEQRGFVEVFYSRPDLEQIQSLTDSDADWRSHGKQNYSWFGWSIQTMPSHVAVSAPNHRLCAQEDCNFNEEDVQAVGKVYLYNLSEMDSEGSVTGLVEFEQMGYDLMTLRKDEEDVLLVSAPTAAGDAESEQQGVLKMLSLADLNTTLAELQGDRKYSGFGTSMTKVRNNPSDEEEFIVGAPRWRDNDERHFGGGGPGRAYVYRITDDTRPELVNTLLSDELKSQFGYSTASSKYSSQTVVAVGAPFSNKGSRLGGSIELFFF